MHGFLETVEDGIQADAILQSGIGIDIKVAKQCSLVILMEAIHYLICKSYKSVDIADGLAQIFVQQFDGRKKGSAVLPGSIPAAALAYLMKQVHHAI